MLDNCPFLWDISLKLEKLGERDVCSYIIYNLSIVNNLPVYLYMFFLAYPLKIINIIIIIIIYDEHTIYLMDRYKIFSY